MPIELNAAQRRAFLHWLGPDTPDDATVGQLREQIAALREAPGCTDLTAAWCPVHGNCTCDRESDSWNELDCPLHNQSSTHPENR